MNEQETDICLALALLMVVDAPTNVDPSLTKLWTQGRLKLYEKYKDKALNNMSEMVHANPELIKRKAAEGHPVAQALLPDLYKLKDEGLI